MKKTKLYRILYIFSAWETKRLLQFLASPFFNRRKELYEFARLITQKDRVNFEKKHLWKCLFPQKEYDETQMRLQISRLFKLVEQYLACRNFLEKEEEVQINLAQAYRQFNKETHFKKTIEKTKERLEKQAIKDLHYLQMAYELEVEQYDYIISQKRDTDTNLQKISHLFDAYTIAGKLKQACLLHSHQAVYKKEYDTGLLQLVIEYVEANSHFLEIEAIAVYYYCYKAITDINNEKYFYLLRQLIDEHKEKFRVNEIRDIYLLAINYCIKRLNTGDNFYIRECFELYRKGIAQDFLLENNIIDASAFRNTVSLALRLKEYKWVEEFLETYKDKLHQKYRTSTYQYNLAKLRYELKQYQEAMKILVQIDSEDYLMNLGARTLLLKIYYELEEFDALDSLLQSMRSYLNRKDVIGYHKDHYKNIISFTYKLMKLSSYDKGEREKLRSLILNATIRSERDWFLKQIEKI